VIRHDVGARPPPIVPIFNVLRQAAGLPATESADVVENFEQRMDGRMPKLGISGVRKFSMRRDFVTQRAFGTERKRFSVGSPLIRNREATGVAAAALAPRCCVLRPQRTTSRNSRGCRQHFPPPNLSRR